MSLTKIITTRIAMGIAVAWTILTAAFALFSLTEDWVLRRELGMLRWAGASEEVLEAFREEYFLQRGLDQPIWESYLDWMTNIILLDWGESFDTGEPALSMVVDSTIRTATYVLPSIVLAIVIGITIGLYAAINPDSRLANTSMLLAYVVFVVPFFWVGSMVLSLVEDGYVEYPHWLYDHALPILFTTGLLVAGYVSYARAHGLEYADREFTKLVKAKGATSWAVAKHIYRNAAIPFVSMLFTEALTLLLLAVFVIEALFGIDGFGMLLLDSVMQRDMPVILGSILIVIFVGVGANIIQDILYTTLDPRVDTGTR